MNNDQIFIAFSNTLVYMAQNFTANHISSENWKVIGQHPEIMKKILEAGATPYKNSTYIQKFYEENPELKSDLELAKGFLFQVHDRVPVEVIFNIFSEDISYFFKDIEPLATWLQHQPSLLALPEFNSLRTNEQLFECMQSCDNLELSWFNLPCPDKAERIQTWLKHNPGNFGYLPEKYKTNQQLYFQTLDMAGDNVPVVFRSASVEMQRLVPANKVMAKYGHYNMLHRDMQSNPDVFEGYCQYILTNRDIINLDFIDTIPDFVWTEKNNIQNFLELVPKLKLTSKWFDHYGKWINTLRNMKKHDPVIAQLYAQKESANHYYHLGSLSEVKKLYVSTVVKKYLVEGITELAKDYRILRSVMDLENNLPMKEKIKTKNKI